MPSNSILNNNLVCVQGLGFVGSAMATAVASATNIDGSPKYQVIGIDLQSESGIRRVNSINSGIFPFNTSDEKRVASLKKAHKNGNISASTSHKFYSKAGVIIVDIQLDIPYLNEEPQLDFKDFKSSIKTLGSYISPGTLVLIETTVPPGTCEKIVVPTLNKELEKRNINPESVFIAHSYERVMPGENYLDSITNYWRVFSGFTESSGDLCEIFLKSVINTADFPLTRLADTLSSETAKILENTYRAVNIAFIDEWTKYAEKLGVNLFEVLDAIRMRPSHSNIRYPGLGVGGYCLTKDPTFAPAASNQLFDKQLEFPFSKMATRINHDMPLHTIDRLKSLLQGSLKNKNILVCGVSYRQDVDDTRYSPSETLVSEMIKKGAFISCHDPYVSYWDELDIPITSEFLEASSFDAIVFAVPHKQYHGLSINSWLEGANLILDANGVFNSKQRKLIRSKGVRIESIGIGDGL